MLLTETLAWAIFDVPYNSFAPILALTGKQTLPRLGGNCIHQVRMLGQAVNSELPGSVTYLVDGRHHAALICCDETTYYMDPYLLHCQPIKVPSDGQSSYVSAYPLLGGRLGKLVLERSGSSLTATKHLPRKEEAGYNKTHQFTYCLTRRSHETTPNSPDLALHPEVTTLSIRIITEACEMISYVYAIPQRRRYIVAPSMTRWPPESDQFRRFLTVMLDTLHIDQTALDRYSEDAISAYHNLTEGKSIKHTYPNYITGGIKHDPSTTNPW
jgi:hypothetical protein